MSWPRGRGSNITAVNLDVDAQGDVVLGTFESEPFPGPSGSDRVALVRYDASGSLVSRLEQDGRGGGMAVAPNGDAFLVLSQPPSLLTPSTRLVLRVDRAGSVLAASTVPATRNASDVTYDPRTDGLIFLIRSFISSDEMVMVNAGAVQTSALAIPFAPLLAGDIAIDAQSGLAYIGGRALTAPSAGYLAAVDVSGQIVQQGTFMGEAGFATAGVVPGVGVVCPRIEGQTVRLDILSTTAQRLESTPVLTFASNDGIDDVGLRTGPDGRVFAANVLSPFLASTLPVCASIAQWIRGSVGCNYCDSPANSTGQSGALSLAGSDIASDNRLTLVANELPANQFGMYITGRLQAVFPGAGGSQGTLCLGGPVGRFNGPGQVRATSAEGRTSLELDLAALPQPTAFVAALAGETWNFQFWYRDSNPSPTSNFTNGVSIVLQ